MYIALAELQPRKEASVPDERTCAQIQHELAAISAQVNQLSYRMHRLRDHIRLPADAVEIYEHGLPWPLELEIDAAICTVIDDHLDVVADRLRAAARASEETLRSRHLAEKRQASREGTKTCGRSMETHGESN